LPKGVLGAIAEEGQRKSDIGNSERHLWQKKSGLEFKNEKMCLLSITRPKQQRRVEKGLTPEEAAVEKRGASAAKGRRGTGGSKNRLFFKPVKTIKEGRSEKK